MMKKHELGVYILANMLLFATSICVAGCSDSDEKSIGNHFEKDVEVLASDEFEGRAPSTAGGEKAKEYIRERFAEIGLKPGNGDSFFQAVPLLETESYGFSPMEIVGAGFTLTLTSPDEVVIGSYQMEEEIKLDRSELVYAGYGIVAPEYEWNDYEGLDVKGKTVIVLVNDPGFATNDTSLFTGRAMTYYGRWTYKFEEAARQGASGALIIHQTEPASYGWDVVRNSWSGTQYSVAEDNNTGRLPMEGWIQYEAAEKLFKAAGIDLGKVVAEAATAEFKGMSLEAAASITFRNRFIHSESHNVLGYIEGSEYPDETVVYMAHWDHLGMVKTENGVEIYNGAVDNASGVAALFAIAEEFMDEAAALRRSVLFMAVTAEESGLLGSKYYADNPTFPLALTVGGINMDALNVYGPTRDVVAIGYGFSELDALLEEYASEQNRVVKPDPTPERGSYYRSDHFNLVRKGVPMIYAKGGNEYIDKDESYLKRVQEDAARRYHSPDDVVHDLWNYEGIREDIMLYFNLGSALANSDRFPEWSEESGFKAIRDSSAHLRER